MHCNTILPWVGPYKAITHRGASLMASQELHMLASECERTTKSLPGCRCQDSDFDSDTILASVLL